MPEQGYAGTIKRATATAAGETSGRGIGHTIAWALIVLAWLAYLLALYVIGQSGPLGFSAYEVYYDTALFLLDGAPVYDGTSGWIYLYPPLLAQSLMPTAAIGGDVLALNLWLGVNFGALFATLYLLSRYIPRRYVKLLWAAPLVFLPVWQAFYIGQITIIMLALLALAWAAVREDRPFLAGGLLALAAWIKVFPALLVVYFMWKRDWHVLRGVLVVGLALLAVQVIVSGPALMLRFFTVLFDLTLNGQPAATYENLSIFGFTSRLFQDNANVISLIESDLLYRLSRFGMTAGMFVLAFYAVSRSAGRTDAANVTWRFDVEYGLIILTILLAGSTLWISGLPPLVLITVLLLRHLPSYRRPRTVGWLWGLALALIVIYQPLLVALTELYDAVSAWVLSVGFFGVALTWGLSVALLLRPQPGDAN